MNKKTPKKLNKSEKAKMELKAVKARLLANYKEGYSNIDYDKIKAPRSVWEINPFVDNSQIGLPLMSKNKWLKREMEKIDAAKPKIPSHRVQDKNAKNAIYRMKFMQAAIKTEPQIIDDLREVVPNFRTLFDKQTDQKYFNTFDELKYELFKNWRIYPDHYDPANYKLDQRYLWGAIEMVFNLSCANYCLSIPELSNSYSDKIIQQIKSNEDTLDTFIWRLDKAFETTAINKDSILPNFFLLQRKIYQWVEKYHLRKDWLVDYAYYFIHQLSQNPELKTAKIEIGIRHYDYRGTMYESFEFKAKGWWAAEGGETAKQYTARLTKEFKEQLNQYIIEASSSMRLDKLLKATKPPTYESVNWLVYSTVRGWSSETVAEKFFSKISADRTKNELSKKAFESTKKHIENEVRKLKAYDLPMRETL